MKQLERKNKATGLALAPTSRDISELQAIRRAQKATAQRVEDLKMRLFHMTEQHMDQAVNLIRRWMDEGKK